MAQMHILSLSKSNLYGPNINKQSGHTDCDAQVKYFYFKKVFLRTQKELEARKWQLAF